MIVSDSGTRMQRVLNMVNFFEIVKAMRNAKHAARYWVGEDNAHTPIIKKHRLRGLSPYVVR